MYYSWIRQDYSLWSKQYLIFNYLKEELSVTVWTVNHLATAKTSPFPFVLWLLSCEVPCRPAVSALPTCPKARIPYGTASTLASYGIIMRNLLNSRGSARVSTWVSRGRCDLFSSQRIDHKLSEFAQVLSGVLAHTHTYVKSWRTTLAGQKGTSTWFCFVFQSKMFIASVSFTKKPSQLRTLDSNSTRME